MAPLIQTDIKTVPLWRRGKVRDVYDLGDRLLVVTTDRISAFDVVLGTPIPRKGVVLNQLSLFWFEKLAGIVPNHVLTSSVDEYPAELRGYRDQLEGRSMIVRKTEPLPVECVVRGFLVGSGWKDYQKSGAVCGIQLPPGLRESERLEPALFTPSTKAEVGHDENISFAAVEQQIGAARAAEVKDVSLRLYSEARGFAEARGILLADTKFEFGVSLGKLVWIDEALTPDSSRFWPLDGYAPGRSQPSFDKQFLRDYLESLGWDKKPPAPALPDEISQKTRDRYIEAFTRLTGRPLPELGRIDDWSRETVKQQLDWLVSEMVEKGILLADAQKEFEKRFIARVLQRHKGNLSRAAKDLHIHRNTLGKKINEYKLTV